MAVNCIFVLSGYAGNSRGFSPYPSAPWWAFKLSSRTGATRWIARDRGNEWATERGDRWTAPSRGCPLREQHSREAQRHDCSGWLIDWVIAGLVDWLIDWFLSIECYIFRPSWEKTTGWREWIHMRVRNPLFSCPLFLQPLFAFRNSYRPLRLWNRHRHQRSHQSPLG